MKEPHDILLAADSGFTLFCTCGADLVQDSPDNIITLDELVEAAWAHREHV